MRVARFSILLDPKSGVGEAKTKEASKLTVEIKYFIVQNLMKINESVVVIE